MIDFFKRYSLATYIALLVVIVFCIGGILYTQEQYALMNTLFLYSAFILASPLWFEILKSIKEGEFGVDLIAGIAILTSIIFGQPLTGLVIVLMLSGGQSLELYAMRRAKRELTNLLQRTPTKTIRIVNGENIETPIDDIQKGDLILVKSGEIIPVDGIVTDGESLVDESSITGEAMPILKGVGTSVISGTENTTGSLVVQATTIAAESRYASIVALVREAAESKSPIVRMADRYAIFFTIVTFVMAALAWILTKNTSNVLAVLVVATPCPLILATPIAMISGMSRMAKNGIIVKNAAAIESLALSKNMFFDKTGTITLGTPEVVEFKKLVEGFDLVALAASLQTGSSHILAKAITQYAKEKNISLLPTKNFREHFGEGVTGVINNQSFVLGKLDFISTQGITLSEQIRTEHRQYQEDGFIVSYIANKDSVIGLILFKDVLRGSAKNLFDDLQHTLNVHCTMITGDHQNTAQAIASSVGIQDVHADCTPEQKLAIIKEAEEKYHHVVMVGDGINDAPALAYASVGIAMAQNGETASTDSADIVILHHSIEKIGQTYAISQKTLSIAKQGIWLGMGMSIIAMVFAITGTIKPLQGAILQEIIDVVVILGALRVLFIKI